MFKIKSITITWFACVLLLFSACEPYEDFIQDFDYSSVYFGTQKPLRTLVSRASSDQLTFKLGVAIGGLRENKQDHWVTFELDTTLLDSIPGAEVFQLLPEDWYSFDISENKIIIPKGEFLGDFTISIDKEKFSADPLSLSKTYALPVKILDSSLDSILRGDEVTNPKDYTIVVVKYINEYSGVHYVRGRQVELDSNGEVIDGSLQEYYFEDWIKNTTRNLVTVNPTECDMSGIGRSALDKMRLHVGDDNTLTLSKLTVDIVDLGCSFEDGVYHLQYEYTKSGKTFRVEESMKQRNDPEKDLRFEEW